MTFRFGGGNPEVLNQLVAAGKCGGLLLLFLLFLLFLLTGMSGRKTGKGMFVYAEGSKEKPVNQVS